MSTKTAAISAALLAGGALLFSSPAQSAVTILPASAGHGLEAQWAHCFPRGWNEPGRVRFESSLCPIPNDPPWTQIGSWWDMPIPIASTGTKWFSVYGRDQAQQFTDKCWALVVNASGASVRWQTMHLERNPQWHNFCSLAVNSNESALISCPLVDGDQFITWVSAVKVSTSGSCQ
jgi:hypothetical protein